MLEPFLVASGNLLTCRRRLDNEETSQAWVSGEQVQTRAKSCIDSICEARLGIALEGEHAEQPFLGDLMSGSEAVALVGKLFVESVATDLPEFDDVLDGGPLEAVFNHSIRQRREHPLPLVSSDCVG
ncbi:MAG TPA: hypothetical protein VGC63_09630 [Solirubrobacterales bacterium]